MLLNTGTWGSKLTKIFAPVLESTPNILEKMVCETNVNEGIVINQAMCLPTAVFVQWRNENGVCETQQHMRRTKQCHRLN